MLSFLKFIDFERQAYNSRLSKAINFQPNHLEHVLDAKWDDGKNKVRGRRNYCNSLMTMKKTTTVDVVAITVVGHTLWKQPDVT